MVTWVWGDIHYPPLFPKHIASLSALMLGWADWSGTNTAICKISQWTEAWLSRVHPLWVNVKNKCITFLNFGIKEDVRSFKTNIISKSPKATKAAFPAWLLHAYVFLSFNAGQPHSFRSKTLQNHSEPSRVKKLLNLHHSPLLENPTKSCFFLNAANRQITEDNCN